MESRRRLVARTGISRQSGQTVVKKGSCGVWVGLVEWFRMVVCFSPQGCKVRLGSTALGRDWDLHVPRLCMWATSRRYQGSRGPSEARSFHGSFVQAPSPGPRSYPPPLVKLPGPTDLWSSPNGNGSLQSGCRVSLPMSIPTLPSRCIILKSWAPDAIPDIISGEDINTATRAWSLTGQADHEHWHDLRQ